MIGLFLFIKSFFSRDPLLVVRRLPPAETLRAHLYGLTLGLVLAGLNLILDLSSSNLTTTLLLLLWFIITARAGGLFFIATIAAFVVLRVQSPPAGTTDYLIMNNCHWYLLGYVFGAGFALLYNDLVYFFLLTLSGEEDIKIAFAYDKREKVNIIKSPITAQERAFNELLRRRSESEKRKLKKQKLYDEHVDSPSPCPYTIALVANPKILKLGQSESDPNAAYEVDPVICDRELFLQAVERALSSLEGDAVIGRPEIWNRVRVVTVFNPGLAAKDKSGKDYGLLKEYPGDFENENNNLVVTRADMHQNFVNILRASQKPAAPVIAAHEVDVVFGITASLSHDRSTARYSDWSEATTQDPINNSPERRGVNFQLDLLINCCEDEKKEKKKSLPADAIQPYPPADARFGTLHDFSALTNKAGQVALNVLSARAKTYIHEFAHAMSSIFHGAVTDEYMDPAMLEKVKHHSADSETKGLPTKSQPETHFYINRIERDVNRMSSGAPIPVPRLFARYECMPYHAELAHPSAEEGWAGYFPERYNVGVPCTMDRDLGVGYRFDDLLSRFIYDRMMAKVTRAQGNCPRP
jgi:hypothetical protein